MIFCAAILAALSLLCSDTKAQTTRQASVLKPNRLAHLTTLESKLGPGFRSRLSSGGANMFHIAKLLSDPASKIDLDGPQARSALQKAKSRLSATLPPNAGLFNQASQGVRGPFPVPVNDQTLDYQLTRLSGFTQSETSSAWCGSNVVVGFNDSGAFIRSVVEQVGGASFTSAAASQDRGRTFTGLPFLNPGSDPAAFLGGDPVVVCTDPQHFFYSSLLSLVSFDSQGNLTEALTGLSISRSSSGGTTWDSPITTVTKDGTSHFLDKEWLAVDPNNPNRLYITYTDFGTFASDPVCDDHITPGLGDGGPDVHIELVASTDGGNSWSAPVIIDRACNLGLLQAFSGSQVVVGPRGDVYVAYSFSDEGNAELHIAKSQDGGATFSTPVVAAQAGSEPFNLLQGNFRTSAFPSLAVDNSSQASRGTLYMAWTDTSRNQVVDNFPLIDQIYGFGDIVLSRSVDGGNTWSPPVLVSPTPAGFKGAGRDQFMAGVAVDRGGDIAVCYSDRRNDPNNLATDHYCSLSQDHGNSFHDVRETPFSWSPGHLTDVFINPTYMGDYDTVSVDATGVNRGFFSSFQIQTNTHPDVYGMRLPF